MSRKPSHIGTLKFVVEAGNCSLNAFPPAGLFGRCEPGKVKGVLRVLPATIPMKCPRWSGVTTAAICFRIPGAPAFSRSLRKAAAKPIEALLKQPYSRKLPSFRNVE